ncbi:MAG: hypothetical protein ABUS48_05840 [Pseudomonadota bacterium]
MTLVRRLLTVSLLAFALSACGFGMKDTDVYGVYHASRGNDAETLTLYDDGNYLHEWNARGEEGRATGTWRIHMLGAGFAQIKVQDYQDRLDPDAHERGDWDVDVRRSSPMDTPRIVIDDGLALYYAKDRGTG